MMFCGQIMTLLQPIKGVAFYLLLCEFMKGFDILKGRRGNKYKSTCNMEGISSLFVVISRIFT